MMLDEEQPLKLVLRQPWVWSVSNFIFLASAHGGGWPVLFVTVSSSHWQCMVSILIIAKLARGTSGAEILIQTSVLAVILIPNLSIGSPAC